MVDYPRSPFEQWCVENEVSVNAQLVLRNLCGLYILLITDDFPGTLKEKEKYITNFKAGFFADVEVKPTLSEFQRFLTKIQMESRSLREWDAEELIEAFFIGDKAELKQNLLSH